MKKNLIPTIATIAVAFIALTVAVAAVFLVINKSNGETTPTPITYTDEELESMRTSASRLINKNLKVLSLYLTNGLNHEDEPYGNAPADNVYNVSSTYAELDNILYGDEGTSGTGNATFAQIEDFLYKTYTKTEAERVRDNADGTGTPVYSDRNGRLGIKSDFKKIKYETSWDKASLIITPISHEKCEIVVLLNGETSENYEAGTYNKDNVRLVNMVSTANGWRLEAFIY